MNAPLISRPAPRRVAPGVVLVERGQYEIQSRSGGAAHEVVVTPIQYPDGHVRYGVTCSSCPGGRFHDDLGNSKCWAAKVVIGRLEHYPEEQPEPLRLPSRAEVAELFDRVVR